ncbi:MAG: FecR family protein, partial [Polyangiales bacterium]
MSKRLEQLGAEVARIQDEALADDRRRETVRRRLSSKQAARPHRAPRFAPALAWASAMAAIAMLIVLLWPVTPEPLAYRVDDGAESTALDSSIAASSDRATSIAFTDGSSVRLAPSASARVHQLSLDGAIIALDRGEATVSVRHRKGTHWSVAAGPFFVRVTGTRFRVGWQPEDEVFDLAVLDGEVRVTSPDAPEQI